MVNPQTISNKSPSKCTPKLIKRFHGSIHALQLGAETQVEDLFSRLKEAEESVAKAKGMAVVDFLSFLKRNDSCNYLNTLKYVGSRVVIPGYIGYSGV